jgi:hypothetical protein
MRLEPLVVSSRPTHFLGICPSCKQRVPLNPAVHFSDDSPVTCAGCGRNTLRRALILEGLAGNDTVVWGYFASDIAIRHEAEAPVGAPLVYELPAATKAVAKWQHSETRPADLRYAATLSFTEELGFLWLTDLYPAAPPAGPTTRIHVGWTRFGVSSSESVPAWRQSFYAAVNLIDTYPSAAVVLVAAGFEALFNDIARIKWNERQLDPQAFKRLNDRNPGIAQLVRWLPETVGLPSFVSAPNDLHGRWAECVNERRNSVVHRATVHLSSDQARESLRVALECATHLDPDALVRPHVYYL